MAFRTERYGIQTEMRGARGVITNLNAIARALDATRLAGTKTFQIDRQVRKLGVQAGTTARQIRQLEGATVGLSMSTGVAVDKTTEVISAYQNAGQALSGLAAVTEGSTDAFKDLTKASDTNVQRITHLVGRFGLGAAAAIKMEKSVQHLGGSFDGLLNKTAAFQQQFALPGMLAQLPKVVGFAMSSLAKFGASVAGNSDLIISDTIRTGAAFAKSYGVDAAEGMSKAMAIQERFLQQTRSDQDVFLGLADDFDPLTKALMETGMGFQQISSITRDAKKDPAAFVESMMQIRDQLGGEGNMFADRFYRNVQKNVPAAVQEMMAIPKVLRDFQEAQEDAAASKKLLVSFDQMAAATQGIGAELLDTISGLALLGKTIVGLVFVGDLSESFGGAVDALKRFNLYLREAAENVRKSKWFQEWKPVIQGVVKVLLGLGAAAAVVATTFASAIIPFHTFVAVMRAIPLLGSAAGASLDGIAGAGVSFAKGFVKPAAILTSIGVALNDFGKALSDPTITQRPMEVFVRSMRAMAIGVVETFDSLLFGIPTDIARMFYPAMKGSLGDATKRIFEDLQLWFRDGADKTAKSWWDQFKSAVSKEVDAFNNDLETKFGNYVVKAENWGKNIGRAIGTLTHWAWEAIAPLFRLETWSNAWDQITAYFRGEGGDAMKTSWEKALNKVLLLAGTFTVNMVDEVLRPWGKGWVEVKEQFNIMWDWMKIGFSWFQHIGMPTLKASWLELKVSAVEAFFEIKDTSIDIFDSVSSHIMSMVNGVNIAVGAMQVAYAAAKVISLGLLSMAIKSASGYYAVAAAAALGGVGSAGDRAATAMRDKLGITSIEKEAKEAKAGGVKGALRLSAGISGKAYYDKKIEGLANADAKRRSESVKSKGRLIGDDKTAAAQLRADLAIDYRTGESKASAPHEALKREVVEKSKARTKAAQAEADKRARKQYVDLEKRKQNEAELAPVRKDYLDRSSAIMRRFETARDSPSTTKGERENVVGLLDRLQGFRRDIQGAPDTEAATAAWNNVIKELSPGSLKILRGEGMDLDKDVYKASPKPDIVVPDTVKAGNVASGGLPSPTATPPIEESVRARSEGASRVIHDVRVTGKLGTDDAIHFIQENDQTRWSNAGMTGW